MELGILDHLFVAFLVLFMPWHGRREFGRMRESVLAGVPDAKVIGYRGTLVWEWGMALAAVAIWLGAWRSFGSLGLGLELSGRWWIGIGVTAVLCGLLVLQSILVPRSPKSLESLRKQSEPLRAMIPENDRETRWFNSLAVTAGICEEIVYRGFLIAYLTALIGVWPAVAVSSIIFGLAHIYQGVTGFFRTGAVGLVMGALFVLSGSLLGPIILHIVLDLSAGQLSRRALEYRGNEEDGSLDLSELPLNGGV